MQCASDDIHMIYMINYIYIGSQNMKTQISIIPQSACFLQKTANFIWSLAECNFAS